MKPILFETDWARFPGAIADTKTTNTSFLKLVATYKKMGIKNADFCLALLQPSLQGVDPYDENLDEATKAKIYFEVKWNPWYYFREVSRIPPNSGNQSIPFKANRGNIALYWSFFNHADFGLLQPRQTGKSVSTDVLMTGMMYIWGENTKINLITKDTKLRNANVERLKVMMDLLPKYIHERDYLDADNQEIMTCVRLGNRYMTSVGRNDVQSADKLGRGLTVPIMQFDEMAYINLIGVSLPVALASGSEARSEAKEFNQPYGNIYTTTAGNITTRDGAFAHQFLTSGAPWTEEWFDLPDEATLHRVVEKMSTGDKPVIYGAFNHRQLGRTDEWLFKTLRDSAQTGEIADRDYFNIWTVGGEGSPLSPDEKKRVKASEREPLWSERTIEGYSMRWWIPKAMRDDRMARGKFVMGLDPSELLGPKTDATGLVIIDIETHEIVATGRYNETNIPQLSAFLANILIKFPNILFIPERKSMGMAIIDYVILALHRNGIDPFKRIFNRVVDEHSLLVSEYEEIQQTPLSMRQPTFYDRFKRHFGYNTTGTGRYSRDSLYLIALPSAMEWGSRHIHCDMLINELMSLVIRNGRIDHSRGTHDDLVISLLLAHWLCVQGHNLSYYGINQTTVFSRAKTSDIVKTKIEEYHDTGKELKKKEFEALIERMRGEKNPMVSATIELKLRALSRQVDVLEVAGVGIDAMIRSVKDERSRRVRSSTLGHLRAA
jgi:hypothetical protein